GSGGIFDETGLERRLAEIDAQMGAPGFWDSCAQAPESPQGAPLRRARRGRERRLQTVEKLRADAEELAAWQELMAGDEDAVAGDADLERFLTRLQADLQPPEL